MYFRHLGPELPATIGGLSLDHFHREECAVCPNDCRAKDLHHPKMEPTGSAEPVIYILGEAPGKQEDQDGTQFVGPSGQLLRHRIPRHWRGKIRWNNTTRCRPETDPMGKNKEPSEREIECCRPSIERDIEAHKPQYIFGFGNVPLKWTIGRAGITQWNGRVIPVKVGQHVCWYFAFMHPAALLHIQNDGDQSPASLYETMKFVFQRDVKRAFAIIEAGLPPPVVHDKELAAENVEDVANNATLVVQTLRRLAREPVVGLDLETKRVRPYWDDSKILTCAVSGRNETIAFPLYHKQTRWTDAELKSIEDALIELCVSTTCRKISFQLGFELEWLAYYYGDEIVHGSWGDAQAQAFLLDIREGTHSLEFVCLNHFGFNIKTLSNLDRNLLDEAPVGEVMRYNGIDAKYHRLAYLAQLGNIKKRGLLEVYQHHVKRAKAAALGQIKGVPVNQDTVARLAEKYEKQLEKVEAKIADNDLAQQFERETLHAYRPSSTRDIAIALYDMRGEQPESRSTREDIIENIRHPLAKLTLDWRHVNKVLSTYIRPLQPGHDRSALYPDGLLHPILNLCKTRTWRSSSLDPNVQNFPKHGDQGQVEAREQIEAPDGHLIVSVDFGQIQARNVAMESLDDFLVRSFWNRIDIHTKWAERLFGLYPRWVKEGVAVVAHDKKLMKYYRNKAKNGFVFASFFGAGGPTVAQHLGVPDEIGYQLSEEFWREFPGVKQWHEKLHAFYADHGYITGHSGFQRHAPVKHTEIINTPIQGDEAIMVFDAQIRLMELQEPQFYANMMVHDDLSFVWPKNKVDEYAQVVIETMLNCPFEWAKVVPISVEMSVGKNWSKMEEIGTYESDKWGNEQHYQATQGRAA